MGGGLILFDQLARNAVLLAHSCAHGDACGFQSGLKRGHRRGGERQQFWEHNRFHLQVLSVMSH